MNPRRDKVCLMCGTEREQLAPARIILGVDGGICEACIRARAASLDRSAPCPPNETAAPVAETATCFMCGKPHLGDLGTDELVHGLHGDICRECLVLCVEMLDEAARA
jgi:hypothetical protein